MSKKIAEVVVHAAELDDKEDDSDDVSVDLIDERLYLGNLVSARDRHTLETLQITHVLTVDLIPLPRTVLDNTTSVNFKYVKLADVPKEDLISHLPDTNKFLKEALQAGGIVLVHCYFGVSRSAAIVIAYMMEKYGLCYEDAFLVVKSKRRFVGPNTGFVAQLRLFGHMHCALDREDPRYKQFRLKLAGQKLKQVKILPQAFGDLIKSDPGLIRERPDPRVYRCKKCRRVVATQLNIIPHIPKSVKIELAKKGLRPPPSKLTSLNCIENGQILIDKLKSLTTSVETFVNSDVNDSSVGSDSDTACQSDGSHDSEGEIIERSIVGRDQTVEICRLMWFVEPMRWMQSVQHEAQGKLHCPQCHNKIGSFSWVMGCKCPCGQKVAPAFYLVPSKVDQSNIVQNVQVTV